MPKAFANAGWLVAIVLTGVLCLMRLVYFVFYSNQRTISVNFNSYFSKSVYFSTNKGFVVEYK